VWKGVKMALGRPRRFSAAFIAEEKAKLNKTREAVKLIQQGKIGTLPNKYQDIACYINS